MSYVRTTGVNPTEVAYKGIDLLLTDTAGQQCERRKWLVASDHSSAVFHVISLACFDKVLSEDNSKERLEDSIKFFEKTVNSFWLRSVPFFLFLNKEDLLEKKIKLLVENGRDLEEIFPGIGIENDIYIQIESCIGKVKDYFKIRFLSKVSDKKAHLVYSHFISATDKDIFFEVFDVVMKNVLQIAINNINNGLAE